MRLTATFVAGLIGMTVVLAGCGASSTACKGKELSVTVCVDGKVVQFVDFKTKPHVHGSEQLYAPVLPLAQELGVPVEAKVSPDGKSVSVSVGGRRFEPAPIGKDGRGNHLHDGAVFVPLKEFAHAAGVRVEIDANPKAPTVAFTRPAR